MSESSAVVAELKMINSALASIEVSSTILGDALQSIESEVSSLAHTLAPEIPDYDD